MNTAMRYEAPLEAWVYGGFRGAALEEADLDARTVERNMAGILPEYVGCSIRATVRGGPNVGYRWGGSYRVTFSYPKDRHNDTIRNVYTKTLGIEHVRKMFDKYSDDAADGQARIRLLALYRDSGIIPKTVARLHSALLKRRGFNIRDNTGLREEMRLGSRYTFHRAKCPKCGAKGEWTEEINGLKHSCGRTWVEFGALQGTWVD